MAVLTPFVQALGRKRQKDVCEIEASMVYKGSSRIQSYTQRNLILRNQKKKISLLLSRFAVSIGST